MTPATFPGSEGGFIEQFASYLFPGVFSTDIELN